MEAGGGLTHRTCKKYNSATHWQPGSAPLPIVTQTASPSVALPLNAGIFSGTKFGL